jgi:uncharacterized cupredoxin-like copper-binding protein
MNKTLTAVAVLVMGGATLALAGCGSTASSTSGSTSSPAPGMMGSGAPSGGHYSRLTCAAPTSLPGSTVTVVLSDMNMAKMMGGVAPMGARMVLRATPTAIAAGQVSLVVENMGWRTHELVILPLAPGAQAGERVPGADGKIDEAGSLGEASASCADGAGDGIKAGTAGWVTVTLAPGRYELVCNLPNHYADGMRQELDVTGAR